MEHAHEHEQEVMVKVSYPNSLASEEFRFPWTGTLQELWDLAYTKLGEGKKPEDELLNRDGGSLREYLNLTLRDAHERELCPGFFFVIKSETGGAHPDYGTPIPNTPSKAASAFEGHLANYLKLRSAKDPSELGMEVKDELTLVVFLTAKGNFLNDAYALRLHFGYYPDWPPSARFVNPVTLAYDKTIDRQWLPSIQGTNEIAVHPDYNGQGQLVCNSMTLEFYLVNHSYSKPEHLWRPEMTFESTLTVVTWALNSPFYKGRQAS